MNTSTTAWSPTKKSEPREVLIAAFWGFSSNRQLLKDSERLLQIKEGLSADLFQAMRVTFNLQKCCLEQLLNVSISTLERRRREQKPLDSIASERLDRIAFICALAEDVFESRETTVQWMSKPNKALGRGTPIMLCETEIGGKQVRHVLHALEWGGAA
ncbi:type II RES/Xre toxin-antitoxin system antitoxin [Pseudomonas fluorescens]|uniref:type II RES/Xre toxin-antitoxin system antitoxin n=1 Tax=Pseudomonas fluorescens TaxID=294 RepID=UPI003F962D2C